MKRFIQHWNLLPSAWLLVIQACILIMTSFSISDRLYQVMMWGLGIIALLPIATVIRETILIKWLGRFFIVGAIFFLFLMMLGFEQAWIQITAHSLEIGVYLCATYGLIRYMLADRYSTKDELFAAAAAFTLLAWAFAYAYSICQLLVDHSFMNSAQPHTTQQSWLDILFFSFSLQTATGLSNLLPIHPLVKIIAILQMFVGVMYLAMIVSRLVGLKYIKNANR
ncbi:ion channel [Acinetobacter baretiae]|uniref:ion channel n=1 Tax=Acinetobacter baretiae TaxID=2605383 RepID=UPI0038B29A98